MEVFMIYQWVGFIVVWWCLGRVVFELLFATIYAYDYTKWQKHTGGFKQEFIIRWLTNIPKFVCWDVGDSHFSIGAHSWHGFRDWRFDAGEDDEG